MPSSWETLLRLNHCGACKSWRGKRKIFRISDLVKVQFPSASEKGMCRRENREKAASQIGCKYFTPAAAKK